MDTVNLQIIYVKEESQDKLFEPIEWILATNEIISNTKDVLDIIGYYLQRWKIERFHYILKSGCNIEKIQERSLQKTVVLILMYSIIAVQILNMTYLARVNPESSCTSIFEENEWKILYCTANKTKIPPKEPYTISKAVNYVAKLGGFNGCKSDGFPGLKVIWIGLSKLYTLISYQEYLC